MNPRPTLDELSSEETEVSFVPMAAVEEESGRLDPSESRPLSAVRKGYTPFKENDVIFAKITPCMENGKVALATGLKNGLAYGSTEFFVFRPHDGVLPRFVLHFLLQPKLRHDAQQRMTGAVGQKRVPSSYLATHPFPLPPTSEQERIVAKLDVMLSRVAAGERAARRALERLERYRTAVLQAAATGELTREWRRTHNPEETGAKLLKRILQERRARWEQAELQRLQNTGKPPKNEIWKSRYGQPAVPKTVDQGKLPRTWAWASVEQLNPGNRGCAYGVLQPGPHVPTGVPLVRVGDISDGRISLESLKRIAPRIAAAYERTKLEGGELLITLVGAVGRAALVPDVLAGANTARAVAVVPLAPLVDSAWVELWFRSPAKMNELIGKAHEVARKTLNLEDVRATSVAIPPLDEQAEIVRQVEHKLTAAKKLVAKLNDQLERARSTRESLLRDAFSGQLVPQDPTDEPATILLARIRAARAAELRAHAKTRRRKPQAGRKSGSSSMTASVPTAEKLRSAWESIGRNPHAKRLFEATGFAPEQVVQFYEMLRATPDIREAFQTASDGIAPQEGTTSGSRTDEKGRPERFRLVSLWLEQFKNLKDYTVRFQSTLGTDVILGWNGTGKSNLFEALVIIFRDLHYWSEKNRWPAEPMAGYRLVYRIEQSLVEVTWQPAQMKRPQVRLALLPNDEEASPEFEAKKRQDLPLPRFVFGYYSGPTNRLAEHFVPMNRDHYERLRKADSDDPDTLAKLLEQRRFFCAETHHGKYVLLAFSYKEDVKITQFLENRLRICGFESVLFIIRRPRWGKGRAEDFWGATGIMRRVMEKLRRYAIAPMELKQTVDEGYHQTREDHYYFLLPDLESLHAFAAEYADARSFFLALESTDFSELIYDVKIQVRVKSANEEQVPITFRELSEGEQQWLMVLGLMRFTKSHHSLILLDEPDTHLNPHWSIDYLRDLASVVSEDDDPSPEQQSSQLLMATHDPLVIASLLKHQVHLLKRDRDSLKCYWEQAPVDPRGLGFTGILISDMFGFRSDLDKETLALLDRQAELAGKLHGLRDDEIRELAQINKNLESLGFKTVSSDPYYRAFIEGLQRRHEVIALMRKPIQTPAERTRIRNAVDEVFTQLFHKDATQT